MAGQLETETSTKKRRNVELNVVPFIDLMTVLTAFLLVTAVWSHTAAISTHPGGHGGDPIDERPPPISVLVTPDALWVGSSLLDARRVDSLTDLEQRLVRYKQSSSYANRRDIEVAAEDTVDYKTLIATLDSAIASGFDAVQVVDPPSLTTRFHH